MTLKETLRGEMITAMKMRKTNPDAEVRLMTLRSVVGAIAKAETEGTRHELTDVEVENILRKEAKTRRETAETYNSFAVSDRAERELQEASIIEEFLPKELTEAEIRELVNDIIVNNGLTGAGGRAIGQVMGQLKARSDVNKGIASKVAKELLG